MSAITGTTVGVLAHLMGRRTSSSRVFEPMRPCRVAGRGAGAWWLGPLSTSMAVLGGMIVLVPGLTVTTALNELATRHLMSGTGRLMGAMMAFLVMGLGVTLGGKLAGLAPGRRPKPRCPSRCGPSTPRSAWACSPSRCCFAYRPARAPWTVSRAAVVYFVARQVRRASGRAPISRCGLGAFVLGASRTFTHGFGDGPRRSFWCRLSCSLSRAASAFAACSRCSSERAVRCGDGVSDDHGGRVPWTGLLLANLDLPPRRAL